jgi:hypothetical protein
MKLIIKEENIASQIFLIRGEKVMLDFHLASLYGVETRVLKQAVKRNIDRFPEDFMFELTVQEFNDFKSQSVNSNGQALRSQIVTLKKGRGQHSKYLPFAFTEQGVAMLSGVLKSKRAIEVNIAVMRTFVQIRKLLQGNKELVQKIKELEKVTNDRFEKHDEKFRLIFEAIKQLIIQEKEPRKPIGFKTVK